MRTGRLLIAVGIVLLAEPILAIQPPDWTAMAVIAQATANSNTGTGTPYSPPIYGGYFIKASQVNVQWITISQAPPFAKDPQSVGSAQVIWSHPSGWALILGTQPGWVRVDAQGATTETVYYRFYRVEIVEDDVGGYPGWDPAYGLDPLQPFLFNDLGGPNKQFHGPANSAADIDIRRTFLGDPNHGFLPTGLLWNGQPFGSFGWAVRQHGMAWLDPLPGTPLNSLVATTRDEQHVRVYLEGPRDPAPAPLYPDGFEIAVRMSQPFSDSTGDVYPGIKKIGGDQIVARFKPPEPVIDANTPGGVLGKFGWPDDWGTPPTDPRLPVARFSVVDDPSPNVRNKWVLHFPWRGKMRSTHYADIEVEARIPPLPVFGGQTGGQACSVFPGGVAEGAFPESWRLGGLSRGGPF